MKFSTIISAALAASFAFAAPSQVTKRGSKLRFFGINESGAEFGEGTKPGVYGKDYTWYNLSTIDVCKTIIYMAGTQFV